MNRELNNGDQRFPNVQNPHVRRKVMLFATAAIVAAVCGYWLLSSPGRERDYVAAVQESMIDEMMREIYEAEQTPAETENVAALPEYEDVQGNEEVADADDDLHSMLFIDCEYEYPPCETTHDALPVIADDPALAEPIPDNAFPTAITGIGILTIESIDLRLPIAEGAEYATLRIAPGRVLQTAQIGDIGNAVIAGHRNYTFGSMFNRLGEIEVGDIMQYQARNGEMMEFAVFEIAIIEPENQIAFLQPLNKSIITLYTCTPIRAATHRLIIRAERIR